MKSRIGLLLGFFLLCGCASSGGEAPAPDTSTTDTLYLFDSEWTSSDGEKIRLKGLKGAPRVLTMVFTRCPSACPMIVSDMKKVESALNVEARRRVRFTVLSFDPVNDTPETLKAFARKMNLGNNWDLLVGSEADTREFAALIGVQYKRIPSGDFVHTNLILAIDDNGRVLSQREGLSSSLTELSAALNSWSRDTRR